MNNVTDLFINKLDEVFSQIDIPVIEQAKKCFIDYFAVTASGIKTINQEVKNELAHNPGGTYVVGLSERSEWIYAIMTNAYAAHVLELDDGHRAGMMHLGAPIFSVLVPIAEKEDKSLYDMLAAAVIGYEAAIRLAKTIQPEHKKMGFHCTGTCGTVGCAMSIAYLLGYSKEQKINTLSAACTSAAGLLEVIMGQSQQKPYNIAHASLAGFAAASYGKYFVGPEDILCGNRGFISNFCKDPDLSKLLDNGKPEITGCYFKPYAACRHCHAPIEAALKVRNDIIPVHEIEKINVATYDLAVLGHDHRKVESINSAKMSTPYGVAIAILYGSAGMELYSQDKIADAKIKDLMDRVYVIEDTQFSALVPGKRVASIDVIMKNGDVLHKRVDYPLGEPENPITLEILRDKIKSLWSSVGIDSVIINEVIDFIISCPTGMSIQQLLKTIGEYGL